MTVLHGTPSRGRDVPHGNNAPSGLFGRLFPTLEGRRPTGLKMAEKFGLPGGKMDGGETTEEQENPEVPAGFTYFGQFIDHNITFDPVTMLDRQTDPDGLTDFRPPRLDLNNVYNSGPVVNPYLYDPDPESHQTKLALSADGADLARTENVALIGDPRNDENMILGQLHLAVIKFHNRVVDALVAHEIADAFGHRLPAKPPDEPKTEQPGVPLDMLLDVQNYYDDVLRSAQQLVRWHYQWIISHEYLDKTVDAAVLHDIRENGPRFFKPGDTPFIPIEFSVAAFRFGHPSVRSAYKVNDDFSGQVFPDDPDAPPPTRTKRTNLSGGPVGPEFAVDWSNFFDTDHGRRPQSSRRILASLNTRLLDLPVSAVPGAKKGALARPVASLAVRNLLRSETLGLPSGQDVARRVGEVPLTDNELGTRGPIYLWYYVLREAEVREDGLRLGPVGGRIVAETLLGLLDADPASYRSVFPEWRPTLGERPGVFEVADLLRFAGVAPDK